MADEQAGLQQSLIHAEYQYVVGLITFYRRVEFMAVAGTGIAAGIVVGAVAAIWNADGGGGLADLLVIDSGPDKALIGNLLALQPWVQVLLLSLQVMALVRLLRASLYIRYHLEPLANRKASEGPYLQFEIVDTTLLLEHTRGSRLITKMFSTSFPVLLLNFAPAAAFGLAAWLVHPDHAKAEFVIAGFAAVVLAAAIFFYGWVLSWDTEDPDQQDEAKVKVPRPGEIGGAFEGTGKVTFSAFGRSLAFFKELRGKVHVADARLVSPA